MVDAKIDMVKSILGVLCLQLSDLAKLVGPALMELTFA